MTCVRRRCQREAEGFRESLISQVAASSVNVTSADRASDQAIPSVCLDVSRTSPSPNEGQTAYTRGGRAPVQRTCTPGQSQRKPTRASRCTVSRADLRAALRESRSEVRRAPRKTSMRAGGEKLRALWLCTQLAVSSRSNCPLYKESARSGSGKSQVGGEEDARRKGLLAAPHCSHLDPQATQRLARSSLQAAASTRAPAPQCRSA